MTRILSTVTLITVLAAAACGGASADQLSGSDSDQGALAGNIARGSGLPCSKGAGEVGCPPASSNDGTGGGNGSGGAGSGGAPDAGPPVCHPTFVPASSWQASFTSEANNEAQKQVTVHGQACMECHTTPAAANIPKFDFGGRVFDEHGAPLALVEVQVKNTVSGKPISAYSNVDGYFWWPPPSAHGYGGGGGGGGGLHETRDRALFPSDVAVRTSTGESLAMCAQSPNGDCGSCHGKAGVLPIVTKLK